MCVHGVCVCVCVCVCVFVCVLRLRIVAFNVSPLSELCSYTHGMCTAKCNFLSHPLKYFLLTMPICILKVLCIHA